MTKGHGENRHHSFEELIHSKLFTFHVGKEKRTFVVHSEAIARTSPQFDALVNNNMVESQTSSADLEDVDPDDFARFIEYAYRSDYTVPPCVIDDADGNGAANAQLTDLESPSKATAEILNPSRATSIAEAATPLRVRGREARIALFSQQKLRSTFEKQIYLYNTDPNVTLARMFKPLSNSAPDQNFTPVFLAHARLYTFADVRLIAPLKRLVLHKLHITLRDFPLCQQRVDDVIELANYAYDHGEDRKPDGTVEELRKLVVQYMDYKISTFEKHKAFFKLLEYGGEFVVDLWSAVHK